MQTWIEMKIQTKRHSHESLIEFDLLLSSPSVSFNRKSKLLTDERGRRRQTHPQTHTKQVDRAISFAIT